MCNDEDNGVRKINRSRKEGAKTRRIRKVLGKTEWYKNKKRFTVTDKDGKKTTGKGGAPMIQEVKYSIKQGRDINNKNETEAVIFVPCTPGGELQKILQMEEDRFTKGTKLKRIKVVERGGPS